MNIKNNEILKDKIYLKINKDIEYICIRYNNNEIKEENFENILFFLSCIMNTNSLHPLINERLLEDILKFYKAELYKRDSKYIFFGGMYTGIGKLAVSFGNLSRKGFDTKEFARFFWDLLIEVSNIYVNQLNYSKVRMSDYDTLYGVSGILYFLLDIPNIDKNLLKKFINYLISLTHKKIYKGKSTVFFHISPEFESSLHEINKFPDGNIDFGMAHGMIAVLVVLAKCKYHGYIVDGMEDAIKKLLTIYKTFVKKIENCLQFPTKLSLDEWCHQSAKQLSYNSGWCYGNAGIVRGLMKTMFYLKNKEKYNYFKEELITIINMSPCKYYFSTPVLCHGYSSILAIQMCAFYESKDERFIKYLTRNVRLTLQEEEKYLKKQSGNYYRESTDILIGPLGIDLALLNAIEGSLGYEKLLMID